MESQAHHRRLRWADARGRDPERSEDLAVQVVPVLGRRVGAVDAAVLRDDQAQDAVVNIIVKITGTGGCRYQGRMRGHLIHFVVDHLRHRCGRCVIAAARRGCEAQSRVAARHRCCHVARRSRRKCRARHRNVVLEAAGHLQKVLDRDLHQLGIDLNRHRGSSAWVAAGDWLVCRIAQVAERRIVQSDLAVLNELEDRHRRERLGEAPDPKQRVRSRPKVLPRRRDNWNWSHRMCRSGRLE